MITNITQNAIQRIAGAPPVTPAPSASTEFARIFAQDVVGAQTNAQAGVSIARFKEGLTNDIGQDTGLLRDTLERVSKPDQLEPLVNAFLEGKERTPAEEFSRLTEQYRKYGHAYADEMERLQSAVQELQSAAKEYDDPVLVTETRRLIAELQAKIEELRQKIKDAVEADFASNVSGVADG